MKMSPEDKALWDERDKRYTEHFDSLQMAVDKAEEAQRQRNQAQNEWREAMNDKDATFARKETVEALVSRMDRSEGRSGGIGSVGLTINNFIMAILALATIVVVIIFRK